jgi:CBS domain-containing protein
MARRASAQTAAPKKRPSAAPPKPKLSAPPPAKLAAPEELGAAATWVHPSALKPWAKNPRKNDGEPVAKVAASIRRFGFAAPIVARRETHEIIAGHTRWKAARQLGLAPWDVPELRGILTEYDLPELNLAGWDDVDLAKLHLDEDEPPPSRKNANDKDDNHCPTCGRYMSAAKLNELHQKQKAKRT